MKGQLMFRKRAGFYCMSTSHSYPLETTIKGLMMVDAANWAFNPFSLRVVERAKWKVKLLRPDHEEYNDVNTLFPLLTCLFRSMGRLGCLVELSVAIKCVKAHVFHTSHLHLNLSSCHWWHMLGNWLLCGWFQFTEASDLECKNWCHMKQLCIP